MLSKKVKRILRPRLLLATTGAVAVMLLLLIYFPRSHIKQPKNRCGGKEVKSPHWLVEELHQPISETRKWKSILLWTDRLACGSTDGFRGVEAFRGCEVNKCRLTADRDHLELASAVVFGTMDFDSDDLPKPTYRQYNVYYDLEPVLQADLTSDAAYGFFDISISTRRTADVVHSPFLNASRAAHRTDLTETQEQRTDSWCGLCQKLHDPGYKPHPYLDVKNWFESRAPCQLHPNCSWSSGSAMDHTSGRTLWFRDAGRTVRRPWHIDWGRTFVEWFRYYRR